MKKKFLYIISIVPVLALSACGEPAEPTISPADLANTAVANAWIAITQTQAAIPTNTATPIPPTDTPSPTFTLFPTLPPAPTIDNSAVGVAPTSSNNPCYDPPPAKPKGTVVQVKLVNNSKGLVSFSMGMEEANAQGECATYSFSLGRFDQPIVTVLAACYWGFAYITDPTSNAKTIAPLCLYETTKTVPISIGGEVIGLQ